MEANNVLISVKNPQYVAGLLRGVLPIGDWSISITLSMFSNPLMLLYSWGAALELYTCFERIGYRVSLISVDFPLPLTPVTTINFPSGKSAFTLFRLFPFAPFSCKVLPLPFLLSFGNEIR